MRRSRTPLDCTSNLCTEYFGAEVQGLNFSDERATLQVINSWVDAKTNHKISSILNRIPPLSVMFLINAIYFNGNWRDKFEPANTKIEQFHTAGGTTQPVSLMRRLAQMSYAETPAYQAVDLPYGNSAFSMTVVLPASGTNIDDFAASLTPSLWRLLTAGFQPREVNLYLPKLRLDYERELNDDLKALGMVRAFDPGRADFSRMSAGPQLYITLVKQKTFVDINEVGTEAAAVTIVVTAAVSGPQPPPPPVMRVDRPYIFVIRDRLTGSVVFMGKIVQIP